MTSEILFQENTEIDSIQQMITTIHNHIAEYRSNLSRRPNVYRPKIAELQANLAQIYWYDYKDYHSAVISSGIGELRKIFRAQNHHTES